jgi:diphosphomevalonate decarboxylase
MKIEASAPSNIALIKYMGKTASETNLPANASLSYTLEHLRSFVFLEEAGADEWRPAADLEPLELSAQGQKKFLAHFQRLKEIWRIPGNYLVRSGNDFPAACGLASSASSFAALTIATAELAKRLNCVADVPPAEELSRLSRRGSGSSCRSFFAPWAVWRGEGAEPFQLGLRLDHAVIVVDDAQKLVSSSEAHKRVTTSLLYQRRTERAEERLELLVVALKRGEWKAAFEICWSEFWDMHALFETSQPAFGYITPGTVLVLNKLREIWRLDGDGPLVTMDAGANVHLLLRPDQRPAAEAWLRPWKSLRSWS